MDSYVFFRVGKYNFAIAIKQVVEVLDIVKTQILPKTPQFVVGVANFRGEILPIIDLTTMFKLNSTDELDKRYIVVLKYFMENTESFLGLSVDKVLGVSEGKVEELERLSQMPLQQVKQYTVSGVQLGDDFAFLLDIDGLLQAIAMEIMRYVNSKK